MRFCISLFIVVGLVVILRFARVQKPVKLGLLIAYTVAVIIITLGSRSADIVTHFGLNPFRTYQFVIRSCADGYNKGGLTEMWKHLKWYKDMLGSIGLNTLLFVPLGFLIPNVTEHVDRWWKVMLLGFTASLAVETIQLVTRLGWFDASDLLHNTLGALIGWIIYKKVLEPKDLR